jgi:hypothetical protein
MYTLQSDKSKEFNGFLVTAENQELTVGDIKRQLPLKGNFYMRFKTILQEEVPPISVWLDGLDDLAPVPTFKDNIMIKVLQLPPFETSQIPRKLYKQFKSFEVKITTSKPSERKQSDLIGEYSNHSKHSERSHSAHQNFADFSKYSEPAKKPFDPMGDFLSAQPNHHKQVASKPKDPTDGLTSEQLKKRLEDKINMQVNKKTEEVQKIWREEVNLRSEKLDAEKEFSEKLNNWESRNHQKNNIRALLATMHNVLWKDSGWEAIGPGDLITNAQVKLAYHKSLNIIHPDKHQNDPPGIRYVAERVFSAVNEAFKKFRNNP